MLPREKLTHLCAGVATIAALCLASCAGQVVTEPHSGGAAGASSTGGTPSTGGASTAGGTGGGGAGAGGGECVPKPGGAGGFVEPTCKDLEVMTISDPTIVDADGDGLVEAGETISLTVSLNEVAGVGFSYYPGVIFSAETPGVTASSDNWLYAILECQTQPMSAAIMIGADVPSGTVVSVTAQVAMLSTDCPDAYAIQIPMTVH